MKIMLQELSHTSSLVPLKSVVETEKKLAVEADFRLPTLSGRPLPRRVLRSTYYDTLDYCLARSGITLRRRIENGSPVWQMKLPLNGARREVEIREPSMTPPARVASMVAALPGRACGTAPCPSGSAGSMAGAFQTATGPAADLQTIPLRRTGPG